MLFFPTAASSPLWRLSHSLYLSHALLSLSVSLTDPVVARRPFSRCRILALLLGSSEWLLLCSFVYACVFVCVNCFSLVLWFLIFYFHQRILFAICLQALRLFFFTIYLWCFFLCIVRFHRHFSLSLTLYHTLTHSRECVRAAAAAAALNSSNVINIVGRMLNEFYFKRTNHTIVACSCGLFGGFVYEFWIEFPSSVCCLSVFSPLFFVDSFVLSLEDHQWHNVSFQHFYYILSYRFVWFLEHLFYFILFYSMCVCSCVCECAFASLDAYTFSFRRSKFGVFNASMFFWPLFVFLLFFSSFCWMVCRPRSVCSNVSTYSLNGYFRFENKKKHSFDFILDALIQLHKCAWALKIVRAIVEIERYMRVCARLLSCLLPMLWDVLRFFSLRCRERIERKL